jgi:hypothetical protein
VSDETLTPLETVALSKAVKETAVNDARPKLELGGHNVDFTVRVSGPMLVAPRGPIKVKEDVPAATILALVLERLTRKAKAEIRVQIDRELAGWREQVNELPEIQAETVALADALLAFGHREFMGTKNGAVTAPLTVTLLGRAA